MNSQRIYRCNKLISNSSIQKLVMKIYPIILKNVNVFASAAPGVWLSWPLLPLAVLPPKQHP